MIGIYENFELIDSFKSNEKASDFIVFTMNKILKEYKISSLIYANGPGSFMGIKVAYLILKTISIIKKIPFKAIDGFKLNNNAPIKANKTLSFVYDNEEIKLRKIESKPLNLPKNLLNLKLNNDTLPNYVIGEI